MFDISDQNKKIIFIGVTILLFILFIVKNNSSESPKSLEEEASCCSNSINQEKLRSMYSIGKEIDQQEDDESLDQDNVAIMNFNTEWCYYSKKFQPIWDSFSKKMKNKKNLVIKDVKCDSHSNEKLCSKYDVEGFPTVKLVKNNKIYDFNGDRSVSSLVSFVNEHL